MYERRHTREIAEYGGLSKVMPTYAVVFLIMTMSSIGLPALNGFIGELLILQGVFVANKIWAAFAASGVVLGAAFALTLALLGVGMGLHTGEVIVGYIGSDRRSEYTAIGDTVNTSSRLEANARGGEILISDATAKAAHSRYKLKPREAITVKNRQQPVNLWEVDWQRASGAF